MKEIKVDRALSHIRVLDLTNEQGQFCSKLLAELGADVIKVEPPGGDRVRSKEPLLQNTADSENGLLWFAYNTNKRSITLDIKREEGRQILKSLIHKVNLMVESYPPGYMSELGLSHSELCAINSRIVMTSITPFGQTGTYANFNACDLTLVAMSGMMYSCGDADRPPVRISVEQTYLATGVQAATASLLALRHCSLTGEGQHIDIAMRECLPNDSFALPYWEEEKFINKRHGVRRRRGNIYVRDLWPCKDGYIGWRFMGGGLGAPTIYALVEWMNNEGMAEELSDIEWESLDVTTLTQEQLEQWEDIIISFLRKHTKAEIYQMALDKNMLMAPANNFQEVVAYPQLNARDFWVDVEYSELQRTITHPGAFCKMSESPMSPVRCAPRVGEHNEEIYINELGLHKEYLAELKNQGVI